MNKNVQEGKRWLELLQEATRRENVFAPFEDYGRELDRHYIGARYPNFYPSGAPYQYYTGEVAGKCVSCAESILKEVEKFLTG
jgi:HEPN domain-containing protein